MPRFRAAWCFTAPFNVTGQPAISLPFRWEGNLPFGVQLVAALGREDLLLSVATQLEAAALGRRAVRRSSCRWRSRARRKRGA
jgi:Asp-tRNA(Asn)/Glu-tRNA(Gln) amidotransferase A subunit family amidase